jgi:hypothetical protein
LADQPDWFDPLVSRGTHEALGWLRNASTRYEGSGQNPTVGAISRQFFNADQRTFDTGEVEKCFMKARQLVKTPNHHKLRHLFRVKLPPALKK